MKLVTYRRDGRIFHGEMLDGEVAEWGEGSLRRWLEAGDPDAPPRSAVFPADDVELLPPVPDSTKLFAVGLNYLEHRLEGGLDQPPEKWPTIFTKPADSNVGHGAQIVKPAVSDRFDYEGELAVVISAFCFAVDPEQALDYVAGYAAYNDGSVRDWQMHTSQWVPGKSFYRSSGFGPWLTTRDEIENLDDEVIETRVNGELRQHATFADFIFNVPAVIAYLSAFTPLRPGDVIATGTPAGVGFAADPPSWLQPGDEVEVSISNIGTLSNTVTDNYELDID